jgi:hypothetical protein
MDIEQIVIATYIMGKVARILGDENTRAAKGNARIGANSCGRELIQNDSTELSV